MKTVHLRTGYAGLRFLLPGILWEYGMVTGSYREESLLSKKNYGRLRELYPDADEKAVDILLR